MLLRGRKVAHPDFEAVTGSWRLAAHVHRLKRLGWPVKMDEHPMEAYKDGVSRHFGKYFLPKELLEFMRGVQN
jgi:hypothetical protein